jgi:hypothetical protein
MNVKGTALTTTRDFVKSKFPTRYNEWLNSLPEDSKDFYSSSIDATKWYPLNGGYLTPIKKMVDLFFDGDVKRGGEEVGRYSADIALKGFYKVFLLVASPNYLMTRASRMFSTFYDPSEIGVIPNGSNSAIFRIIKFDNIDTALEFRIAGWIKRALEFANCREPSFQILKSKAKGDETTDIEFKWS